MDKSNLHTFLQQNRSGFFGFLFLFVPAITVYVLALDMSKGNIFVSIICLLVTYGNSLLYYIRFERWAMEESRLYWDSQVYEMVFLVTATCYSATIILLSILPGNPLFDIWNMGPWIIIASLLIYAARLTNLKKYPRNENADVSKERIKSLFILVMMVGAGLVHAFAVLSWVHVYIGILHPIVELIIGGVFVTFSVLLAFNRAIRPFRFGGGGLS
ncbi:MAG: hypothetical protein AAB508_03230 [Patescibacteria group bacterium]